MTAGMIIGTGTPVLVGLTEATFAKSITDAGFIPGIWTGGFS